MNKTQIEWVKNPDGSQGYTWNPITGCLNHIEGMCKGGNFPCYAYRLANGRLKDRYLANSNVADISNRLRDANSSLWDRVAADPFYPRFWEERKWQPARQAEGRKKSLGIFTCDMSDLFGIGVPEQWTTAVLKVIRTCHCHRFYLLTKQPQNLIKFSPFPPNCFVGVTATNETMFHNACYYLEKVIASVKFLSFEPLLSFREDGFNTERLSIASISWVIIGAQTKPYKPPKIEWVQEIVEACDKAGIPVFIKDNLKAYARNLALYPTMKVGDEGWDILRQEMPR